MSSDYTFSLYHDEGVSDLFDINIPDKSPAPQLIADANEDEGEEPMDQMYTSTA